AEKYGPEEDLIGHLLISAQLAPSRSRDPSRLPCLSALTSSGLVAQPLIAAVKALADTFRPRTARRSRRDSRAIPTDVATARVAGDKHRCGSIESGRRFALTLDDGAAS